MKSQLQHKNKRVLASTLLFCTTLLLQYANAATSPNYGVGVHTEISGRATSNSSANYSIGCSEFGKIGNGIITSTLYSISSALPCDILRNSIQFRFAPEKRVAVSSTNLDMKDMQIVFRAVGSTPFSTPVAVSTVVSDSDSAGYSLTPAFITATPGSYDVFIKSSAHLTQKYGTLLYSGEATTLDFTQSLTRYARAGDVNGSQFGDDEINALDISVTIAALSTGIYRPDTNQDGEVNALDIGILLANLGQTGE